MKSTLNESVLVLNRLWQAVNICTARRAFCLLYQKHAQVVHTEGADFTTLNFDDWCALSARHARNGHAVQTVSCHILIPKVILLAFFDRSPRKEIKLTRYNVFERDRHQCQYCGKTLARQELNLDHVHPRDRGGLTTWENVVCSCIECNARKSNLTPQEAGMRLLRPPRRPRWRPFLLVSTPPREETLWRHFLDPSLWNVEFGENVSA